MLTPPHPHLIPAIRNWMLESFEIVHLQCDASKIHDVFLQNYVQNGILTLSVGPNAVPFFEVDNEHVRFASRFNGIHRDVIIPATSVLGIIGFNKGKPDEREFFPLPQWIEMGKSPTPSPTKPKSTRPKLSVVK